MNKSRNIVKVIEAIKNVIKSKEKPSHIDKQLLSHLDKVAEASGFQAPEMMSASWIDLMVLLQNFVRIDTEEGKKISAIMRDEVDVGAREEKPHLCFAIADHHFCGKRVEKGDVAYDPVSYDEKPENWCSGCVSELMKDRS